MKYEDLDSVYPRFFFDPEGNIISGALPHHKALESIKKSILSWLKRKQNDGKSHSMWSCYHHSDRFSEKDISYEIVSPDLCVIWHELNTDKYYDKAEIVKHIIKGRGRGRLGFCYCVECAKSIGYICSECGSPLIEVSGYDHPGGEWGIRGVREPAPMSF
jgi:hypothetical protein